MYKPFTQLLQNSLLLLSFLINKTSASDTFILSTYLIDAHAYENDSQWSRQKNLNDITVSLI